VTFVWHIYCTEFIILFRRNDTVDTELFSYHDIRKNKNTSADNIVWRRYYMYTTTTPLPHFDSNAVRSRRPVNLLLFTVARRKPKGIVWLPYIFQATTTRLLYSRPCGISYLSIVCLSVRVGSAKNPFTRTNESIPAIGHFTRTPRAYNNNLQ